MAIGPETLRLLEQRAVTIDGIVDDVTRQLVRDWSRAWNDIAAELTDALETAAAQLEQGQRLNARTARRVGRVEAAMVQAADQLDDLAASGRVTIRNSLGEMARAGVELDPQIIASQYPSVAGSTQDIAAQLRGQVPSRAVDEMVRRAGEQITAPTRRLSREATQRMRSELTRGMVRGRNPRETARRMVTNLGGGFNGGLARATMIARTEQLDAYRRSTQIVSEANADVLRGQRWFTQLDGRTCAACVAQHGSEWPHDAFGPEGHHQCRCTYVPVTRSWRDLGFDVDEPPQQAWPDRDRFWQQLDDGRKRNLLGDEGLARFESGELGWDDLAKRTSNDGWRDSFVAPSHRELAAA